MKEERIEFACEECGKEMSHPVSDIGTVQQCPHCGEYVDVPEDDQPAYEGLSDDERGKLYDEQLLETTAQQVEGRRQFEEEHRLRTLREEQLQRMTLFLARCESLADRFERVLERWEKSDR